MLVIAERQGRDSSNTSGAPVTVWSAWQRVGRERAGVGLLGVVSALVSGLGLVSLVWGLRVWQPQAKGAGNKT